MYANKQVSRAEKLKKMPEKEYKKLVSLLYVQSTSQNEWDMVEFVTSWLYTNGYSFFLDSNRNIIVKKGEAEHPPCVVAHLDTVHSMVQDYTIYNKIVDGRKILFAQSGDKLTGIGGDDKCGIYYAMYALEHIDDIVVVFFSREEIGMIGSSGLNIGNISEVGYIIQLDRWGRGDFIDTYFQEKTVSEDYSELAKPILDKYGFKSTEGLFTDSIGLWNNDVGVSAVNVSCGYYQHHSVNECIDTNELWNSTLFTTELIKTLGNNVYESKPKPHVAPSIKKYDDSDRWHKWVGVDYERDYVEENQKILGYGDYKKIPVPEVLKVEYLAYLWMDYDVYSLLEDENVKDFYQALNAYNLLMREDNYLDITPEEFELMLARYISEFTSAGIKDKEEDLITDADVTDVESRDVKLD